MPPVSDTEYLLFKSFFLIPAVCIGGLYVALLFGCRSETKQSDYKTDIPQYFPQPLPVPESNPTTRKGIELGKMLFFDKALSPHQDIACSTCHKQELFFADKEALSVGHDNEKTRRNTPPLINLAWAPSLFWDGGGANLESVSLAPLHQKGEMGWQNLKELENRLRSHAEYPKQFKEAFGTETIEIAHILRALAQYQRSISHVNSRWDNWQQGSIDFSKAEMQGWTLFQKHCAACHTPPLFSDFQYHKVTIETKEKELSLDDPLRGRARVSQQMADEGSYRTPTLRGNSKTQPYLHDGRFQTLDQLFSDSDFNSLHAKAALNQEEKTQLINFLKTLD